MLENTSELKSFELSRQRRGICDEKKLGLRRANSSLTAHEYHEKRTTPNFQVLSYQPEHVSPLRRTREAIEDLIKFSSEIHICRSLMCFTVPLKKPRRHNRTLVSSRKSLSALFSDVWPVQNGNSEKKTSCQSPNRHE